jgi:hypothetical protein
LNAANFFFDRVPVLRTIELTEPFQALPLLESGPSAFLDLLKSPLFAEEFGILLCFNGAAPPNNNKVCTGPSFSNKFSERCRYKPAGSWSFLQPFGVGFQSLRGAQTLLVGFAPEFLSKRLKRMLRKSPTQRSRYIVA